MKDSHIHIDKLYLRCTGITGVSMGALSQAVAHGDLTFSELGLSRSSACLVSHRKRHRKCRLHDAGRRSGGGQHPSSQAVAVR